VAFAVGTVMLITSIIGLMPGDRPFTASSAMFTQLVVNILMLLVATILASAGMFLLIYGGEAGTPEIIEE
jgi:hypothetical protein